LVINNPKYPDCLPSRVVNGVVARFYSPARIAARLFGNALIRNGQ
jgi:hypothetical protein